MAVTITVTNSGRVALVNPDNTGTRAVKIASAGLSATAVVPSPSAVSLPGEFKRISTLSGDVVADDTIHLIVRDEGTDVFTVRSVGLYLDDGTLFAIYGQADPILEKSSQAMMLLAIDARFADIDANLITFGDANFLNPPATTETKGVIELATVAEAQAGIDALRGLTPAAARAAILGWLLGQDGAGSGLDADMLDGQHAAAFGQLAATNLWTGGNTFGAAAFGGAVTVTAATLGVAVSRTNVNAGYSELATFRQQHATGQSILGLSQLAANVCGIEARDPDNVKGSLRLQPYGGTVLIGTNTAWHAGNDGAGSGLDADFLDGQDGSYYTNITARLGYTPINKGGDSVGGEVSFTLADSAAIASRVNTSLTPLQVRGNGTGAAVMTFHRPNSYATFFGLDTDNKFKFGGWSAGAAAFEFWHTGNDGAGSGLDADTVDGLQAGSFARVDVASVAFGGGVTAPYLRSTGTMSVDSTLVVGGIIQANHQNGLLIKPGGLNAATVIHRNDGSNYYLLLSNAGAAITDTWNSLRPFTINLATGGFSSSNGQNFSGGTVVSGSLTLNGAGVWTSANDGAGSGLDADTLDGLQASQFLRNSVSDWSKSEEGASRFYFQSNGSTYARVIGTFIWQNNSNANIATIDESGNYWGNGEVNALRFRSRANGDGVGIAIGDDAWIGDVNWANGVAIRGQTDGRAGYVTFGTSGLGLGCNAADATLRWGGLPVWHSGNDGAGSGMDADTLDGYHASAFVPSGDLSATGWCRLPNGLLLQWGRQGFTADSYGQINFPIAFSSACFYVGSGVATEVGNGSAQANGPLPYAVTTTYASMYNAAPAASAWWIALGV